MNARRSAGHPAAEVLIIKNSNLHSGALPGGEFDRLQVNVLYTTYSGTLAALRAAAQLGANLKICSKVTRLCAVPYPLPLERPAISRDFLEEQMRRLACESSVEFTAQICLCREPQRTLRELFPPHSLIVIANKKRWWLEKEHRWVKVLKEIGHKVILV